MIQISSAAATEACSGGIDSDGSFRCNGEVMQTDALEFAVATGQFVFSSGAASSFHETEEVTATLPTVDCDIRGFLSAQFIGAAFVGTNGAAALPDEGAARLPGSFAFAVGP